MCISKRRGSHLVHRIGGIAIDLVAVIAIDISIETRPSHLSNLSISQPPNLQIFKPSNLLIPKRPPTPKPKIKIQTHDSHIITPYQTLFPPPSRHNLFYTNFL